jgi:hypothetical protein
MHPGQDKRPFCVPVTKHVGTGWNAWVRLPGNPPIKQAPEKPALPVRQYRAAQDIAVPDEWVN